MVRIRKMIMALVPENGPSNTALPRPEDLRDRDIGHGHFLPSIK